MSESHSAWEAEIAALKSGMLELLEFFKHAELFGSRARASWKQEEPNPDSDWDFVVFTDDDELIERLKKIISKLGEVHENEYKEMWVTVSGNVDLCIMPSHKKRILLSAYQYQDDTGCSKEEMKRRIIKWTRNPFQC